MRIAGDAVALVDAATGRVKGAVALGSRPGDLAVSGRSVWVTLPDRGVVVQIDARTMTVEDTVPVGAAPSGVAVGGGSVWVANSGGSTVSRISPQTNAVVQTIGVPASPTGIVVDRHGVWVASSANDTLSRIDPDTGRVAATIAVDDQPVGLALDQEGAVGGERGLRNRLARRGASGADGPVDRRRQRRAGRRHGPGGVWVANRLDGTVSRIDADSKPSRRRSGSARLPPGWPSDGARCGSRTRRAGR